MKKSVMFWGMVLFALIGLAVSAYLTYLSSTPPSGCPIGGFSVFSCDEVIWSKYSHFCGISVAFLGLGWFAVAGGLLLLARQHERVLRGLVVWSLIGAAGVAGFVYTEIFLIGTVCVLCTLAHISGLVILALSIISVYLRSS